MPELRRELEVNPQSVEARAMLALLLLQAGQAADASSYAKKAAEDGPPLRWRSTPTGRSSPIPIPRRPPRIWKSPRGWIPPILSITWHWRTHTQHPAETTTRAASGRSPSELARASKADGSSAIPAGPNSLHKIAQLLRRKLVPLEVGR
jgi:hypothetical protein